MLESILRYQCSAVTYLFLWFWASYSSCHYSDEAIRSALLPNYRTRNGMHSCNLVKYSVSESSDFKDSLWEIIFREHNYFLTCT